MNTVLMQLRAAEGHIEQVIFLVEDEDQTVGRNEAAALVKLADSVAELEQLVNN